MNSVPAVYIVGFVSKKQLENSLGYIPLEKRRGGYLAALAYALPQLQGKPFTRREVVRYIPQGWRLAEKEEIQKIKQSKNERFNFT